VTTRLGIELTPVLCRVLELEGAQSWYAGAPDTVVRSCAVLPPKGAERRARLQSFRGRQASVVVWGVPSEHRQVVVDDGSYEAMRAEARAVLETAGIDTRGAWCDITPVGVHAGGHRRPVIATLAAGSAMESAIQPLIDAGIRVRAVMTPAAALAAVARSRSALSAPGSIEAYVALEETTTSIALMRGGALIAARVIVWGAGGAIDGSSEGMQHRAAIAARLGDELTQFIDALGEPASAVSQICVCGDAPDLRSTTMPLIEWFEAEVETLDSLFAIDARQLPGPNGRFQERAAEWRVAWAAAAEWPPAINLLRQRRRNVARAWLARAAVAAGIAAGLGADVGIATSSRLNVAARGVTKTALRTLPFIKHEPPADVRREPPIIRQEPVVIARQEPAPEIAAEAAPVARQQPVPTTGVRPTARARDREEAPPFDAVLETILFSPERQLAIIDGRVVGRGDGVKGATVVEITPAAVLLRDSGGRLRRLTGDEPKKKCANC
jgi:hypothetical protein